jgi:hypothetical protein
VFYAWLEEESEIAADPMVRMKPPAIPEQPIPVLPDDALRRLFATCAGKAVLVGCRYPLLRMWQPA